MIYEPKLANDAVSACRWSPCVSPHLPNLRLAPHWPPGRSAIEALRRGSCCSHERAHFPCHLCRHAQWTTRRRFITSRASSQLRANDDTNGHSAILFNRRSNPVLVSRQSTSTLGSVYRSTWSAPQRRATSAFSGEPTVAIWVQGAFVLRVQLQCANEPRCTNLLGPLEGDYPSLTCTCLQSYLRRKP